MSLGSGDVDRYVEQLRRGEYLKESEVKSLCVKAREILVDESNVQRVDAPVTVCVSPITTHTLCHTCPLSRLPIKLLMHQLVPRFVATFTASSTT